MQVSVLKMIDLLAADQLTFRFAGRAVISVIGYERASNPTGSIGKKEADAAIAAIETPSMDDHIKGAELFGSDMEKSFLRDSRAAAEAAKIIRCLAKDEES